MKAISQDRFGSPDVLELRELDEPEVGHGEVLVRVRAASVNPADWYAMMGVPYVARPQMGLRKPRTTTLGFTWRAWWPPSATVSPTSGRATRCSGQHRDPGRGCDRC
jgi:hypothetical protein